MLRTVETYVSYQGEGPHTSRPTLFVRFAGCNFKCPGWPCDTQHAIQPKLFKDTQKLWSPVDLADHLLSFDTPNICLTGGEVFLQNQKELTECIRLVRAHFEDNGERPYVEAFTNGALKWDEDLILLIDSFILDWKLFGSGEEYEPNSVFEQNFNKLNELDAIKFTIKHLADYEEAKRRYYVHIATKKSDRPQVYAGVVWGAMATEQLAQWMLNDNLDWSLNVQVHKFVWDPDKIGV